MKLSEKYGSHVTTLINNQATYEAIDDYFNDTFRLKVKEQLKKSPNGKIGFFCFYSGHGNWIDNGTTIFLAHE